jgi:hypothetical protein
LRQSLQPIHTSENFLGKCFSSAMKICERQNLKKDKNSNLHPILH